MSGVRLRRATIDDAPAINDILNYYVEHSTATFILSPQTLEERLAWFDGRTDAHPVIAAELDGVVVGWAALSSFRSRAAYAHTVELGVYLRHDMHRRGIGRALVEELIALARAAGHHAVVGGACGESTASIALLRACGFEEVAHFREVGRKFDRWLDVVFFERILWTMAPPQTPHDPNVGLCARCAHVRIVESDRGARFYRCEYSRVDPSYPKYPALPVRICRAYTPPAPAVS